MMQDLHFFSQTHECVLFIGVLCHAATKTGEDLQHTKANGFLARRIEKKTQ